MKRLQIGRHVVGEGERPLVIAEIGVNHDGSVDRAVELVHLARICGADAVKLQVFSAARLMDASAGMASYQRQRCSDADGQAMLRRYELAPAAVERVVSEIRRCGLLPLATPFSPEDVDILEKLDLPAIKIASPDLANPLLLERAIRTRRPLLVSTGAATLEEVEAVVTSFKRRAVPFALLHCISAYPTPAEAAHLGWIEQMHRAFNVPVGWSDHTTELQAGAAAAAVGACIIEKHLTYDCRANGPDHAASATPEAFQQYVRHLREGRCPAPSLLACLKGSQSKRVLDIEQEVRDLSRQSLVLKRDLGRGEMLTRGDVTVKRPGMGIPAHQVERAMGRYLLRTLPAGTMLQWDMLEEGHAARQFAHAA